ncbi:MAG TPA: hypothetical protein VN153_08380 [Tahibacter sp.]|nr:hypothetical protein [Tahibacter sp.]
MSFLWWRRALHRSIAMRPIRRRAIAPRAADAHEPDAQSAAHSTASSIRKERRCRMVREPVAPASSRCGRFPADDTPDESLEPRTTAA